MDKYFTNIKDILKNIPLKNVNPVYGQIISEWDILVGKKFAGKTEIADFVQKAAKTYLYVNVSSSPLVQELTFFKLNLIKKIKSTYNLEIADIIVKVANKNEKNEKEVKPNVVQEVYDMKPTEVELSKIELPKEDVEKLIASISTQKNLSKKEQERFLNIVIKDLKTQEWLKQKGAPVCKKCGCVITRKNFGEDNLCRFCRNEEQ